MEDFEGGASEYHGVGGPISVRICPDAAMRSEEFLVGVTELGYDGPHWDYNGERQENGAGLLHFHIGKDGRRCNAAVAFLDPIRGRPNLTLKTGAEVTRLLIEGKRAVGVEYQQDGQTHQVCADREVIVSAGALQSPKLLMLSGIGPAEQLRKHGIPVVVDLPGVGQNLQDHVQVPFVFRTKTARPHPQLLTGNILFVNTRTSTPDAPPDMQLLFTPAVPTPLSPVLDFGGPACIFLAILVQPESVGAVGLARPTRSIRRSSIRTTCRPGPTWRRSWKPSNWFARSPAPGLLPTSTAESLPRAAPTRKPLFVRRLRHSGTPPGPAKWDETPTRWSIRSCGSAVWRACASSTPR